MWFKWQNEPLLVDIVKQNGPYLDHASRVFSSPSFGLESLSMRLVTRMEPAAFWILTSEWPQWKALSFPRLPADVLSWCPLIRNEQKKKNTWHQTDPLLQSIFDANINIVHIAVRFIWLNCWFCLIMSLRKLITLCWVKLRYVEANMQNLEDIV